MEGIKEPQFPADSAAPLPGEYGFPIPKEILYRELGFGGCFSFLNNPRRNAGKRIVSQSLSTKAVNTLCTKDLLDYFLSPGQAALLDTQTTIPIKQCPRLPPKLFLHLLLQIVPRVIITQTQKPVQVQELEIILTWKVLRL